MRKICVAFFCIGYSVYGRHAEISIEQVQRNEAAKAVAFRSSSLSRGEKDSFRPLEVFTKFLLAFNQAHGFKASGPGMRYPIATPAWNYPRSCVLVMEATTEKPTRWGIMGSGLIASDFVGALKASEAKAEVVAVGARSLAAAQKFSEVHGVERAYEGYETLASDPEVDVVYVGTVAQTHMRCVEIAIEAGKHVLVEKPIALNAADAAALSEKARAAGVFLMEGMWTRAFPAVAKVREWLDKSLIGDIFAVQADFGWPADPQVHTRLFDQASGGVLLDVAMYPLAFVLLASGGAAPASVSTTGSLLKGVDWNVATALSGFKGCERLAATVMCSLEGDTLEEVVISGKKGTIRIHSSAHIPTRVTLSLTTADRGMPNDEQTFDFPLPPEPEGALPFNYPGSQGFQYEANLVHEALAAGKLEADEWTHSEMVTTLELINLMRTQVQDSGNTLIPA